MSVPQWGQHQPPTNQAGLPGLKIGKTIEVFHMDGMSECW